MTQLALAAPEPLPGHWVQLYLPAPWAVPPAVAPAPGPARRRQGAPGRRKCSPVARARTVSLEKLGARKRRHEDLRTRNLFEQEVETLRPRTRADCKDGPRPCPWVGCRYHLAISWDPERPHVIKETFPHLKIIRDPEGPGLDELQAKLGTCALDVCDALNDGTGEANLGGLLALRLAALSGKPLGVTPGMSIKRTGRYMNISVERARQLATLAMQELRVKLRREPK